jgi:quinol monooxygenase YgiN
MRVFHAALIAVVTLLVVWSPVAVAQAPDNESVYVVTYIEVAPSAGIETGNLLRRLALASRKETGNLRYDVLQQIDRHDQFAILETWSDAKAFEAHGGGAPMKRFRDELSPLRIAFYDQRRDTGIDVGPIPALAGKDAIIVITHVDVTGPFKDEAIAAMKKFADSSRREANSVSYEVWQQNNRLNHFTVTEVWKEQAALDAHTVAPGTREFREKLGPMLGALYDDRRYKALE